MIFGHGFTGLVVASIVSLTSGLAFAVCVRELAREIFGEFFRGFDFDRELRRRRDIMIEGFVSDHDFNELLIRRETEGKVFRGEWGDRSSYLATLFFLGLVALAGLVAGLSHFPT